MTAALGIFVFALATARSQDARRQITQPVPVDVVLSREGQQRFERQLGRGCGTSSFTAVAVAGRFPDVTVAVPPQGQCMAATLELGKGVATVIPRARG